MSDDQVYLRCSRQGSKLRVQIISNGYFREANCQFPRAIRADGRTYSVPPSSIRLAQSAKGTYFYRVTQPITILDENEENEEEEENEAETDTKDGKKSGKKATKKRSRAVAKPAKVFDSVDEPDCVICLDSAKERICVPCGHYCMCADCIKQLVKPSKCPMCRTAIATTILPSEL
ncbi:hypothetical protein Poli38472_005758 [Pythium oligandrum]|uniref:RING-type domain-containing protein n=1 Tax=Pythium oligandrum TaxID=41045 RepID=A0A8K1CRN1_PYTOL|nr:hypothetical protein Poli38472_005758 [Pythium oligandrum]|eukprot:TMW68290.1 hypothetical protein Poli38472_005758 [Pythium oligandrum]